VATVGELVEDGADSVEIRCAPGAMLEIPGRWAGVVSRRERPGESIFRLEDQARLHEVLGWLLGAGVQVRAVTPQRPSLESLFMAAAEDGRERREA
jgi:hypothetical protein